MIMERECICRIWVDGVLLIHWRKLSDVGVLTPMPTITQLDLLTPDGMQAEDKIKIFNNGNPRCRTIVSCGGVIITKPRLLSRGFVF